MQRSLAPIIAGCVAAAAFVFAAPIPASAITVFAPAVHYGETADIVEPVGRYYRGRGYRRYGYGRGYRNYGYRNYGYRRYGYGGYGYRRYGYGGYGYPYYRRRPGINLWFGY
jgi:hypothetical protein